MTCTLYTIQDQKKLVFVKLPCKEKQIGCIIIYQL